MAIYFIGDIQGCYRELRALLKQVNFTPSDDQLWAAGDLVARGPDSYATLKYLYSLGDSFKTVLGNHDLHLIATYVGLKKAKANDKLDELLSAPDVAELINWLASQPLLRKLPEEDVYLSHAGLPPQWTIEQAVAMAEFAQKKLNSVKRDKWLARMYGEQPNSWNQVKSKEDKFRYTINAFTRMRYCELSGALEFHNKLSPKDSPKHLKPWFELATNQLQNCYWIFGHWAALMGEVPHNNLFALDTGCVWGGDLTLLRWHDKRLFTEPSQRNLL
ncbi:bis(5'-nucleosyl)-tetraphosphatase, symmetrical [Thalassotalea insulae]|uniref:Bis(5'-nucleosyl)-tetraphosphatase, symmetrical n=1 Tax=Thalassotalea insulae TaxID=2056778 RepID=A0ABQ6GWM1_9GAMM|nr:symmetrical bis(5'-nucleosyl)-tetraphosphatase [Thalassotalea insulae]GLX79130.1 bis(5'-nucleosyl)-tetraphosphatase, symmetrical [Thalassotalea insulae]